jgi:hypothetical protein
MIPGNRSGLRKDSVTGYQERLASDEESKVGQPYGHSDRNNKLIFLPNSDPGGTHEAKG